MYRRCHLCHKRLLVDARLRYHVLDGVICPAVLHLSWETSGLSEQVHRLLLHLLNLAQREYRGEIRVQLAFEIMRGDPLIR